MPRSLKLAIVTLMVMLPSISMAGDEEIAQQIVKQLQEQKNSGDLKGFNIGLQVQNGVVWLEGHVSNKMQHAAAVDVARRVPGVKQVVDGVRIETVRGVPAPQIVSAPRELKADKIGAEPKFENVRPVQLAAKTDVVAAPQVAPKRLASVPQRSVLVQQSNVPTAPQSMRPLPAAPGMTRMASRPMSQRPVAFAPAGSNNFQVNHYAAMAASRQPMAMPPAYYPAGSGYASQVRYDNPQMPRYAWPSYAAHPNYAALTYPKQHSPSAWPYIGPFYPYPQVPLGWRKVTMEWDKGWWTVDFKARR
ncbi:MAG: hypothetical protein COA78_14480 [Blastopirellula sp.]|nr:MAG: hypothetical protein COA78_14480 [Blastopirellula sp.]